MQSQFYCTSIQDYGNQRLAIVHGAVSAGAVFPGMTLCMGLGDQVDVTFPISAVLDAGELLLDCDDQEGVDMLLAFAVAHEYLAIQA
ncbi:hypothetical protein [Janthinobacterium sp. RT4P48]|uniref:hypothetical protein n=1 Tax=Janthinobacterium sp. RT4P48 TaxID=3424188 RepID=UPI003F252B82